MLKYNGFLINNHRRIIYLRNLINQNAISVILESFVLSCPNDKIAPLLDLKTMLTLVNGKLPKNDKIIYET